MTEAAIKIAEPALIEQSLARLLQQPIIRAIVERMKRELPTGLHYHTVQHTEDVLREMLLFALSEGVAERQIELLAIAAVYHDAGFLRSRIENEEIGATYAREAMEKSGAYSAKEIRCVVGMIRDTQLVRDGSTLIQRASSELAGYLLDADLSNLGRDDFFEKGELQRREIGLDKDEFLRQTHDLLAKHEWKTAIARSLRQKKKEENFAQLQRLMEKVVASNDQVRSLGLGLERLGFLAKLPLLLNSSLDPQHIIHIAIENLKHRLQSEAATIFLTEDDSDQLVFWALEGGDENRLEGRAMPRGRGIVGWVIDRRESVLTNDARKDPRFFATVDEEGEFETRNLICVPLVAKGDHLIGAVQVLNKLQGAYTEEDLLFLEQFGNQVALAVDNARLFKAVREKQLALEALERRKNEMIGVIAHEFRTPLNVIQASSDLLSSGMLKDAKAQSDIGGTMTRGVERLTKLVTEIRNLALISKDQLKLEKETLLAAGLVQEALDSFTAGLKKRSLRIELQLSDDGAKVEADRVLLVLALKNLISNAIRYTPDGGTIVLSLNKSVGMVEFCVRDTGIGIDRQHQALIFEKFYEIKNVLHHSSGDLEFGSGGLGIGLATVKGILSAHRSKIILESELGLGSSFRFSLPAVLK